MLKKPQISEYLRNLYFRFWWIDVMYPIFLALIFFAGLSYLFYTGQKHRRIASSIEERAIKLSLSLAKPLQKSKKAPKNITIITYKPIDHQSSGALKPDASAKDYVRLITKLLNKKAQAIFVSWHPLMHRDEMNYKSLIKLQQKAKKNYQKIYWGIHPNLINHLPLEFQEKAKILEADPCQTGLQIICIYNPRWKHWVMQKVFQTFSNKSYLQLEQENLISHNLPRLYTSYLLNLKSTKELTNYSFKEVFEEKANLEGKYYFIGPDTSTTGIARNHESRMVNTLVKQFTPLHEYWAQHAHMIQEKSLIKIASQKATVIATFFCVIFAIFTLIWKGAISSLGIFIVVCFLAPFINALSIQYLKFYVPIFDIVYAGVSTFFLASFSKLSIESFHLWRLKIQQRVDQEIVDAKGNFISLISHNLNTPVAKMQGMLSAIEMFTKDHNFRKDLQKSQTILTKIQLAIRFVLVTTALEEEQINPEAVTIKSIINEINQEVAPLIKKLGYKFSIECLSSEDLLIPVRIDKRALKSGLLALLVLLEEKLRLQIFKTHLFLDSTSEKSHIILRVETNSDVDDFKIESNHTDGTLLKKVSSVLLQSLSENYGSKLTLFSRRIELSLQSLC